MTKLQELVDFMDKFPTLNAQDYKRYAKSLLAEEANGTVNAVHGDTLKKLSDLQGKGVGTTDKDIEDMRDSWDKPVASSAYRAGDGQVKSCNCVGPENCRDTECALVQKRFPMHTMVIPELRDAIERVHESRPLTKEESAGVHEFVMSHFNKCSDNPSCPLRSDVSPERKLAGEIRKWKVKAPMNHTDAFELDDILAKYDGKEC